MGGRANWRQAELDYGWVMPRTRRWKRLPVIRHVRAVYHLDQLHAYTRLLRIVGIGLGDAEPYDYWVIAGIWFGKERCE